MSELHMRHCTFAFPSAFPTLFSSMQIPFMTICYTNNVHVVKKYKPQTESKYQCTSVEYKTVKWRRCNFLAQHTYQHFTSIEAGNLCLTRHTTECNFAEFRNILLKVISIPSISCPHLTWSHIITNRHWVPFIKWFSLTKQRYDGATTCIKFFWEMAQLNVCTPTHTHGGVICPLLLTLVLSCRDDQFLTCITSNIIPLLWQDAL